MSVSVLICLRCGSHHVDIRGWRSEQIAVVRCAACDREAELTGFTVGRLWSENEPEIIRAVLEDVALPVLAKVAH